MIAVLICLSGCSEKNIHDCIEPLPPQGNAKTIMEGCIPANFSTADFNWKEGKIRFTAFYELRYASNDVDRMTVGDTLFYDGKKMPVAKIKRHDSFCDVNGGLEQGGAWLSAKEGGAWPLQGKSKDTYRAVEMDDHSVYMEWGKAEMPLSSHFTLIDCGDSPQAPYDTLCAGQRKYLEQLKDYRQTFSCVSTRIYVEHGTVTSVVRRWIP